MAAPLTRRETEVFDFIREFQAMNDNMPISRVLAEKFDMSISGVHNVVVSLMRKGRIESIPGQLGYRFARLDRPVASAGTRGSGRPEDDEQVRLLLECVGTLPARGWNKWEATGPCPLPPGRGCEVRLRNAALKEFDSLAAQRLDWRHSGTGSDIVAYRLR